jgi:predicted nucleic acid-binding protein
MSSTKTRNPEPLLLDTSVLLEATDEARAHHVAARTIIERRARLVFPAQVVREFLVVATRPVAANGLGMALADALDNVRELRRVIRLLPEEKPVLPVLLSLLDAIPCRGKRIHDAHLVATAIVHRVKTIITLNMEDFLPFHSRVNVISPDGRSSGGA